MIHRMKRRDEMVELVGLLDGDPAVSLEAVRRLQELLDEELLSRVAAARNASWSWRRIGDALGVTAQSVHRRFAWLV